MDTNAIHQAILKSLNDAFQADPQAIQSLMSVRIPCNEKLGDHPTVQVAYNKAVDHGYTVGALGVLNGALLAAGLPVVAMMFADESNAWGHRKLLGFTEYRPVEKPQKPDILVLREGQDPPPPSSIDTVGGDKL